MSLMKNRGNTHGNLDIRTKIYEAQDPSTNYDGLAPATYGRILITVCVRRGRFPLESGF